MRLALVLCIAVVAFVNGIYGHLVDDVGLAPPKRQDQEPHVFQKERNVFTMS